jgi:parallel beta-helix repeat protein
MRKIITLITLLFAFTFVGKAQYTTPGTGINWGLQELITNSAGAIVQDGSDYRFTAGLLISAGDTISILSSANIIMNDATFIECSGAFIIDPVTDSVKFTADVPETTRWRGFRLADFYHAYFKHMVMEYGGGMRALSDGSLHVEECSFRYNYYESGSTGSYGSSVIDISGHADIIGNVFIANQRGGISSPANANASANIISNLFFGNVTENSNRPQINMGPSGENDTTYIIGNTVIGNGFDQSGGIAFSSLVGVAGNAVIENNFIDQNRYGITLTGSPINGIVRNNNITNNNIQNNPALGGSGINFTASTASSVQNVVVTGNIISGNLWGITIIGYPQVNMGDTAVANYNPGNNVFSNNGNGGLLYDLYNNGPVDQMAMGNCWGVETQDSVSIETVVSHVVDDPSLGRVYFMPAGCDATDEYTVTFNVTDGALPVEGASISINDVIITTNELGSATIEVENGTYPYEITKAGYVTATGIVVVEDEDVTENVILTMIVEEYTVTFRVNYNDAPFEGAEIKVAAETLVTNNLGIASIILSNGTYDYLVTAEGYDSINGTLTVDGADIEIIIGLTTGLFDKTLSERLSVYPNPATDYIFIEGINTMKFNRAELFNLNGLKITTWEVIQDNKLILGKSSGLTPGMYLLNIYVEGSSSPAVKRIMIK